MEILFIPILVVVFVIITVFIYRKYRKKKYVSNKKKEEKIVSKITMITAKSDVLTFNIGGSGKCTIDWGDGTSELLTLTSYPSQMYTHSYIGTSTRTITITYENITHISFYEQLSGLDLSGCATLQSLICYDTQLTNLDISGCTALQSLTCFDTKLTNLDVSSCTALSFLQCKFNSQLTNLNVKGCKALLNLDCSYNQLSSAS